MSDCDSFSNLTENSDSSVEYCNFSLSIHEMRTTRQITCNRSTTERILTEDRAIVSDCDGVNAFEMDTSVPTDAISADEEIILAVYWKRGRLGAAFYNTCDAEVHLLNDVVDIHPNFQNLRCLLNQVEYTHVITCSSLADSFIQTLAQLTNKKKNLKKGGSTHSSSLEEPCREKLGFIPGITKNFNYDTCKRLILGHRLFFEPKYSTEEEHLLFMDTYIDFKKKSMVMSLGLLLKFLEKYIQEKNLSRDPLRIAIIQNINL